MVMDGMAGRAALEDLLDRRPMRAVWTQIVGWLDDHVDALDEAQCAAVDRALASLPPRLRTLAPQWAVPRLDLARARFARCLDTRQLPGVTTSRLNALAGEGAEARLPLTVLVLGQTAERSTVSAWTRALWRMPIETLEVADIAGRRLWNEGDPEHPTALRALKLEGLVDIDDTCRWSQRPELAGLVSLELGAGLFRADLSANAPRAIDPFVDALAGLESLRALTMHGEHFYDGDLTTLAGALGAQLERLDLSDCRLDDDALTELLAGSLWPALRALDVSNNLLSRVALERLAQAPLMHQLTELSLGMCGLGGPPLTEAVDARRASHVSSLGPTKGRRSGLVALSLAGTGRASASLRVLRVPGNALDADDMGRLLEWLADTSLDTLDLSDNPLGADALRAFAGAAGEPLRSVTQLDLSACGLDADAARALATGSWPSLTRLSLTGNRLGPTGARELVDARWGASLKVLEITVADVGAEGMRTLQRAGLVSASAHQVAPEASAIAEAGARAWHNLIGHLAALEHSLVGQAPPDFDDLLPEDGAAVVVAGFDPALTWSASGRTQSHIGNPDEGFFWIRLRDHRGELESDWGALIGALERWRRVVPGRGDPDLSDGHDWPAPWQLAGWSGGPDLQVPEIRGVRSPDAHFGLHIQPFAIWVPGHVLVTLDDHHPGGATFVGEPGASPRHADWLSTEPAAPAPPLRRLKPWALAPEPEPIAETGAAVALADAEPVTVATPVERPALRTRWRLAERIDPGTLTFTADGAHLLVTPYRSDTLRVVRTWLAPDGKPWPTMVVTAPSTVRRVVPDPWRPHRVHLFLESGRALLDLARQRLGPVEPVDRGVFMARVMPDDSLWLATEDPDSRECELWRYAPPSGAADAAGFPWGPRSSLGGLPRAIEDVWGEVSVSPVTGQLVRSSVSRMVVARGGDEAVLDLEAPEGIVWRGHALDAAGETLLRVAAPDERDGPERGWLEWCTLPSLEVTRVEPADVPRFVDALAVSPDGLLTVMHRRTTLHVWRRDPTTGALSSCVRREGIECRRGMVFSADGVHLAGAGPRSIELWPVAHLLDDKS